jgi:hypothetical protein
MGLTIATGQGPRKTGKLMTESEKVIEPQGELLGPFLKGKHEAAGK